MNYRTIARRLLSLMMVTMGVLHFSRAESFLAIMPPWLPAPLWLVWVSGVFEILGGVGLEPEVSRRYAAWGLIALFIAVFPANVHMAVNDVVVDGEQLPPALLWGRLPFQALFIAWAYWFTRPEASGRP